MASGEILINNNKKDKVTRKRRRYWVNEYYKSRNKYNATNMLYDLTLNSTKKFENFCRMSPEDFEYLLNKIGPSITKTDTNMRKSIPIQEKLAVTLRYLASGDSFISLSYMFKFSPQSVSRCVQEVCSALIQELKDEIKVVRTRMTSRRFI
ncbi:uncharacterized protein LOC126553887 [Aphis gossypii]|uniref:uncharacterized protein LOC126553887 n=1 Tax=Aphis gossypii TaxID=80765 RepID=UPI002159B427|nr:uncharacterized protein LOC126553887 [Aphis gossypii]